LLRLSTEVSRQKLTSLFPRLPALRWWDPRRGCGSGFSWILHSLAITGRITAYSETVPDGLPAILLRRARVDQTSLAPKCCSILQLPDDAGGPAGWHWDQLLADDPIRM